MRLRFTIAMIMTFSVSGAAAEIAVAADILVPADRPTIQDGIDMAFDGDRVIVAPGTYVENIDFLGKAITVVSESGPDVTVIDGDGLDSVVRFESAEGRDAVLEGFTITNGFSTSAGGGIQINYASPTIVGNYIIDNRGCSGIGINNRFGSSLIQGNIVSGNVQSGCSGGIGGAGIAIGGNASAEIVGNTITNNILTSANGAGISLFAAGTPIIRDNLISGNSVSGLSPAARGAGISMVNVSDATIVQNVIVDNTADQGGGIYWLVPSSGLGPLLVNNTIAQNTARQGEGSEIFAAGFDAQALLVNNLIVGNPGQTAVFCDESYDFSPPMFQFNNIYSDGGLAYDGICADQTGFDGNISDDPFFADPLAADFRLQIGSPSVDVGDSTEPNLPALDFLGNARIIDSDEDGDAAVDMGAIERLVNEPPIADAGPDQTANSFQTVFLSGSGSYDADGEPDGSDLAFEWSIDGSVIGTGPNPTVGPFLGGILTITLMVADTQGDIDFDTMVLTVQTLPPVADAGPDQTATETETVVLDGTGSSDPEGTPLSYVWTLAGAQIATGLLPSVGPFSAGSHEITLTVTDGDGGSASDTMSLTVVPAPPVAVDDLELLPKGRTATVDVLANDEDVFGAGLTIVSVGTPLNGTASLNPDSTVTYRRDKSFKSGCDEFTYTVEDGRGLQATGNVFVQIGGFSPCGPPQPNTPPVANNDTYTMTQGTTLTVAAPGVLANDTDADGDSLTRRLETGPEFGVLGLYVEVGGFIYTPPASLTGDVVFTYWANDGTDDSNIASVVITVAPQGAGSVHVGDIDGTAIPAARGKWSASATVEVHSANPNHAPIAQAQVFGSWQGTNGETSCITDEFGRCSLEAISIGKKKSNVTFIVDNIVSTAGSFVPGDNHDPDGDSNAGSAITIFSP